MNEDRKEIHNYFSLTYASYLVLPRSVLQSMPSEWQDSFVRLLEEIPSTLDYNEVNGYRVNAVDSKGKFVKDDYANYERGRRRIPFKTKQ